MFKWFLSLFLLFSIPAKSETLTIVVHTNNSQPYHNSLLICKHIVKYYPGATDCKVKAVPGARGIVAANYIYNIAPKDGLTFGTFTKNTLISSLVGEKQAQFEIDKFNWLGSTLDSRNSPSVVLSNLSKGVKEFTMGEAGSTEDSVVNFIKNITGWKINRVSGYKDIRESRLAFTRKEIDSYFLQYSTLMAVEPTDKPKIIIQYGNGLIRHPELKNVPTLMEIAADDKKRYLVAVRELTEILSRPYVLPPGVSKEKVDMLRQAFLKVMNDSDFRKESQVDIDPIYWDQAQTIIRQMKSIDIEDIKLSIQ